MLSLLRIALAFIYTKITVVLMPTRPGQESLLLSIDLAYAVQDD
jgi:hypothetical protein